MQVKLTKENLVYSFSDNEGNAYYKFPKDLDIPIMRLAKIKEFLMWLQKGVDPKEYASMLKLIKVNAATSHNNTEAQARVVWGATELENRQKMVLHDELFYNLIAVQLIRQDELVGKYNHEIQMQKVEAFKELDSMGDGFFLHIAEYLQQLGLSNTTMTEYNLLVNQSKEIRLVNLRMLNLLSQK